MGLFSKLVGGVKKTVGFGSKVAGALGSLYNSFSPAIGAGLSYYAQKELMEKQQAWLERMSNTEIQRRVADSVQAGVNPLYSMNTGGGASTPSASLAAAPDFASAFSMGNQSRIQANLSKSQQDSLESQALMNRINSVKLGHESDLTRKEVEYYDKKLNAQLDLLGAQAQSALQAGSASSAQASYYNSMKLGQDLQNIGLAAFNYNEDKYYKWLGAHPNAQWRYYNGRVGLIPGINTNVGFGYGIGKR